MKYLALFVAILAVGAISSGDANAASTFDTYTDGDGVVWDRETTDEGDIYIGIKSVPNGVTTVTVPAIGDVASGKDTYFLDAVCSRITDCSGVISDTATVTVLDMTNASKIQIKNVSQMFNATHEVELIFGANVVIADPADIGDIADSATDPNVPAYWSDIYPNAGPQNPYTVAGAFEGMRVKLTGLDNIKYIGWNAFKDTTLNSSSQNITISDNQTVGGYVFAGSNIAGLSINAAEIGQGFCENCAGLSSLTIGDNVTTLRSSAFTGTTALAQDFDAKNITTIGARAFLGSGVTGAILPKVTYVYYEAFRNTDLDNGVSFNTEGYTVGYSAFKNAGLDAADLSNLSTMEAFAFADNNITEVYLSKNYRKWQTGVSGLFEHNPLKKITLAYDLTINHGALQPLESQIGRDAFYSLEEIVVIAPYGADEAVAADHIYYQGDQNNMTVPSEVYNSFKNVIPREFFDMAGSGISGNPKKIVLDDNIEMIGSHAFGRVYIGGLYTISDGVVSEEMSLPSKLRVIGSAAFLYLDNTSDRTAMESQNVELENMPESVEYIGSYAFVNFRSLTINNFDLPNMAYLGEQAFSRTLVKNIVLHEFDQPAGQSLAFFGKDGIETVTVDYDFFGAKHAYGSEGCLMFDGWCSYDNFNSTQHFTKVKFTANATTAPSSNSDQILFQGIWTDEMDLSETPWTALVGDGTTPTPIFLESKIGTFKLPSSLEYINPIAFLGADIDNLVLPETIKEIGDRAFSAVSQKAEQTKAPYIIQRYNTAHAGEPGFVPYEFNSGVGITSLPSSIEKIGEAAFLNDTKFEADLDSPNLTHLGNSAFQGTNVRDVTLGDGITKLGANAFYNTPSLRNITIDMDLYNAEREYGDETEYGQFTMGWCYTQSGEECDESTPVEDRKAARDANYYDSFVATFGDQDHKYGTITFTENAGQPCEGSFMNCAKSRPYFYGIQAAKVDLSATDWVTTSESMFQESEIDELILPSGLQNFAADTFYQADLGDVTIPTTLVAIQDEAFQEATANINGLPEGLGYIGPSAFYAADVTDNLVIPSTVGFIGQSAFNAGDADVHYDTITIKPNLSYGSASSQLIHQMFWNVDVDKMIIASVGLPASSALQQYPDGTYPEFYNMPMDEVVITNLQQITKEAFQNCTNLKKVDMSSDANLRVIANKAFINDSKFDTILFSPSIKNEIVTIGQYAFEGTAFRTMGDNTKQFDLTAANFDATAGFAFSKMPLLETVDIPRDFSNKTVPEATFANDPELRLVTIDYKTDTIDNAAFSNDNKLESIFIWGDTEILDENLAGRGGDAVGPEYGPTIPEPTDIYAYSTSRAEEYAALPVRGTFEGDFYPLDEVLYLTSNKPTVLLNDDETDFDKSDLVVYAMRRDGVILESDEWSTYDGNAYPRSTSSVDFEHMAEKIQEDPVFGSIHDTPVPMNELDVTTNVNFANIDFALAPSPDKPNVKVITLLYNDKYTDNLADTDIVPYEEKEDEGGDEEDEPAVPDTGAAKAMATFTKAALPIVAIVSLSLLAGVIVFKKRKN